MLKEIILKANRKLYNIERKVIFISLMLICILSFIQILLRILLNSPLLIIELTIRNLVMFSCLLSSSIVTYHSSHFKIEIVQKITQNPDVKKILGVLTNIFVFGVSLVIFIQTIRFIRMELDLKAVLKDILAFNLEPSYISILLPVIFFNLTFHAFSNIIELKEQR